MANHDLADFYDPQWVSYTNRTLLSDAAVSRVEAFVVSAWVVGVITMFRKAFGKINMAEKSLRSKRSSYWRRGSGR